MPESTLPFFGNPNVTKQAAKGRKTQAKTYEDTWLDSFIKGMFGDEQASGSVLQDNYENKAAANNVGQAAGVLTDLAGPIKALGGAAALGAIPMLQSVLAGGVKNVKGQTGAIRVGGAKDLVATHAFSPQRATDIADDGFLRAPSIGITSREANDYGPSSPQFIFRAGALDPNKQRGALINRDGYFGNPHTSDPKKLQDEIARLLDKGADKYGTTDTRLLQGWPGDSQALAIAASPNFKSFAEFEKSSQGAQSLRTQPKNRDSTWKKTAERIANLSDDLGSSRSGVTSDIVRRVNRNGVQSLSPEELKLWHMAQNSPSAMAEFKLYDNLPINPADAFVHVPTHLSGVDPAMLNNLSGLRDAGFQMIPSGSEALARNLQKAPHSADWTKEIYKQLPNLVPPSGQMRLSAKDSLQMENSKNAMRETAMWNDWVSGGGGSPPLYRPPSMGKPAELDPSLTKLAKYVETSSETTGKGIHSTLLDIFDDPHMSFTTADGDALMKFFKNHPNFKEETVVPKKGVMTSNLMFPEVPNSAQLNADYYVESTGSATDGLKQLNKDYLGGQLTVKEATEVAKILNSKINSP